MTAPAWAISINGGAGWVASADGNLMREPWERRYLFADRGIARAVAKAVGGSANVVRVTRKPKGEVPRKAYEELKAIGRAQGLEEAERRCRGMHGDDGWVLAWDCADAIAALRGPT